MSRSPQSFHNTVKSNKSAFRAASPSQVHSLDPELVSELKILPSDLETEIKEGFFELKQKFKETSVSSIYISHIVLH